MNFTINTTLKCSRLFNFDRFVCIDKISGWIHFHITSLIGLEPSIHGCWFQSHHVVLFDIGLSIENCEIIL